MEMFQPFHGKITTNRNLIVIYGATTKSIPAQTTPYKIIVMCWMFFHHFHRFNFVRFLNF